MLPSNAITVSPLLGEFIYPVSLPYTPLTQLVLGGVALGDASQGRVLKEWTVAYTTGVITVSPAGESPVFTLSAPDATSVSLTFDSSMNVVLCWVTLLGASLYYYDAVSNAFTTQLFAGVTSARVAVDDTRAFNNSESDVIFAYTLANTLHWRQQRDRYSIEYTAGPCDGEVQRMGLSTVSRFQFEFTKRANP